MVLTQRTGTVLGTGQLVSSKTHGGWEYLIHQLAYAMTRPESRPMFIDKYNEKAGTCASVSEAFATRRPFATDMIPEIIPIDLDTDQTSIEDVSGYLDQRQIPYLVCRSGGAVTPGVARHHVFLWVPDGCAYLIWPHFGPFRSFDLAPPGGWIPTLGGLLVEARRGVEFPLLAGHGCYAARVSVL
jgi:hypothetical protein